VQLLLYRQQEHKNSDDYDENIHATNGSHISWLVRFDSLPKTRDVLGSCLCANDTQHIWFPLKASPLFVSGYTSVCFGQCAAGGSGKAPDTCRNSFMPNQ